MTHATGMTPEKDLIRMAQGGDSAAFDQLVLRHRTSLLRMIRTRMWDAAEAEDVTQEAFLCAWKGIQKFRGECTFYTWLYHIGRNAARTYLRDKYGTEPQDTEELPELPERIAIRAECELEIIDVIAASEKRSRQILALYEVGGLSYAEVAAVLSMPIGTVRSRLNTARKRIQA